MKSIIFPKNILKLSPKTKSIFITKKYREHLFDNFPLTKYFAQPDVNSIITILNDKTTAKCCFDFGQKHLSKFLSYCKGNITFKIQDMIFELNNSNKSSENPIDINQLEIFVDDYCQTKLTKQIFAQNLGSIKTIKIHNCFNIPKNICFPTNNNTIQIINNSPSTLVKLQPQVSPNCLFDLSNVKNIAMILPLFSISYDPLSFFKGIDYFSIINQIVNGVSIVLNKDSNFVTLILTAKSSGITGIDSNKWFELIKAKTIKVNDQYYWCESFSNLLKTKITKPTCFDYRFIWLSLAKSQQSIQNTYYYYSDQSHQRKEILQHIINIVEESLLSNNRNFLLLKSYIEFEKYIKSISKNKKEA